MSSTLISPIGRADTLRNGLWLPRAQGREGVWSSSNDFANPYELGYHTGVDLVLHLPGNWGATPHKPIVACADGIIIYARRYEDMRYWGNLIILKCTLDDGTLFYCRYGHVEFLPDPSGKALASKPDAPIWQEGLAIKQGDLLASVGNGSSLANPAPLFEYHLHYDISLTDILARAAGDWPGADLARLKANYTDPYLFTKDRLDTSAAQPDLQVETVVATANLNIRAEASKDSAFMGRMDDGTRFQVETTQVQNGYVKLHQLNGWVLLAYCIPVPIPKMSSANVTHVNGNG